jgi:hypothetical protein
MLGDIIASIQSEFKLMCKGDMGAFLGLNIMQNPDGFLELRQPGLIKKMITECRLMKTHKNTVTPCTTAILQHKPDSLACKTRWNYHMMIGMLTYLSASSRLDVAYARTSVSPIQ